MPPGLGFVVNRLLMNHPSPVFSRTFHVCADEPPQLPASSLSPDSSTLLPPRSPIALEATELPEPRPRQLFLLLLLLLPLTLVLLAAAWGLRWQRARRRGELHPGVSLEPRVQGGWMEWVARDEGGRWLTLWGTQVPLPSHP